MSGVLTLAVISLMIYLSIKFTKLCERFERLENTVICSISSILEVHVPPDDKEPWER